MRNKITYILFLLLAGLVSIISLADSYRITMHIGQNKYAVPTDSIKNVVFNEQDSSFILCNDSTYLAFANIDSITHETITNDTLYIQFSGNNTIIQNPRADILMVDVNNDSADVIVKIRKGLTNPVLQISGSTNDGRLRIDSDVDYTVRFAGVDIQSINTPALNSTTKQKVTIELADGTENNLADSENYSFSDTLETANGCLNCLGAITFKGNGTLNVTGNAKHAIYSKKSINFKSGKYIVQNAVSDAVHSGKNITVEEGEFQLLGMQGEGFDMDGDFSMTGGNIEMDITGEAAKGVKCAGIMTIEGGKITATASGTLKNKKGDLSYCTILKCDSNMTIKGGDLHLINNSPGGKCISADHNLTILGGTIYSETNGDGAEYTNAEDSIDYYTSKCIAADDSMFVHRGNIRCFSTGIGGKGIVTDGYMEIGSPTDTDYQQGPTIIVETTNSSIVNDVDEDQRYGCPKAIKSGNLLYIFSGNIKIHTHGIGGEGIESKGGCKIINGNIECYTYDDGLNMDEDLTIEGGSILCISENSDGIDSNNSLLISGGVIASTSKQWKEESFDADSGNFILLGGTLYGIGNGRIFLDYTQIPFYHSSYNTIYGVPISGFNTTTGKFLSIVCEGKVIMSQKNNNPFSGIDLFVASNLLDESKEYEVYECDSIEFPDDSYFDGAFSFGGKMSDDAVFINKFKVNKIITKDLEE